MQWLDFTEFFDNIKEKIIMAILSLFDFMKKIEKTYFCVYKRAPWNVLLSWALNDTTTISEVTCKIWHLIIEPIAKSLDDSVNAGWTDSPMIEISSKNISHKLQISYFSW